MKLELDKEFFIESDENNFTLYKKGITSDKAKVQGLETIKPLGYYGTLQNALKGYHRLYFQNSMMMFECEPKAITHYFNTTKATMKAIYQEITRILIEKLNYPEYIKTSFL